MFVQSHTNTHTHTPMERNAENKYMATFIVANTMFHVRDFTHSAQKESRTVYVHRRQLLRIRFVL